MRKIIALMLCVLLLVGLCACKKAEESSSVPESGSSSSASVSASSSASGSKASAVHSIVAPESMNTKEYTCNVASIDGLILRVGPSTEYDAIGVIEDGTAMTELANQNGWVYVDVQGQQGWVFGQYVEYKEN